MGSRNPNKLKVPRKLADERFARLMKFIELKAPEVIITGAAELWLRSFKWEWRFWFFDWKMRLPHRLTWLLWLLDKDYRMMCKQTDDSLPENFIEDARDDDAQ